MVKVMYLDDCIFLKCCYHRILLVYSPRMWRWSRITYFRDRLGWVFSTYVEMILKKIRLKQLLLRILHVCGDDPKSFGGDGKLFSYSPRMWRWSLIHFMMQDTFLVFSTYVEMIPNLPAGASTITGILHVCGDDP